MADLENENVLSLAERNKYEKLYSGTLARLDESNAMCETLSEQNALLESKLKELDSQVSTSDLFRLQLETYRCVKGPSIYDVLTEGVEGVRLRWTHVDRVLNFSELLALDEKCALVLSSFSCCFL